VAGDRRLNGGRAIATLKLAKLARGCGARPARANPSKRSTGCSRRDIKRFLERPAQTMRVLPAPDAPPGAPSATSDGLARAPPM